jgi:hypothetical protein
VRGRDWAGGAQAKAWGPLPAAEGPRCKGRRWHLRVSHRATMVLPVS